MYIFNKWGQIKSRYKLFLFSREGRGVWLVVQLDGRQSRSQLTLNFSCNINWLSLIIVGKKYLSLLGKSTSKVD